MRKNNTSGHVGVSFQQELQMWQANKTVDGKRCWSKFFKTAEEAAVAREVLKPRQKAPVSIPPKDQRAIPSPNHPEIFLNTLLGRWYAFLDNGDYSKYFKTIGEAIDARDLLRDGMGNDVDPRAYI